MSSGPDAGAEPDAPDPGGEPATRGQEGGSGSPGHSQLAGKAKTTSAAVTPAFLKRTSFYPKLGKKRPAVDKPDLAKERPQTLSSEEKRLNRYR